MYKAALALFILIFFSTLSLLVLRARDRPVAMVNAAPTPSEILKAESSTAFIRSPRADKRFILALSQKEHAPFSSECADYFESLESLNLNQWAAIEKRPKYRGLLRRPEKCTLNDSFLERMHSEYVRACRIRGKIKVIDENIERTYREPISDECVEKIIYMRATLARLYLQDKPAADLTDVSSLLDLLLSEFLMVKKDVELAVPRVNAYAKRLLELHPQLYLALRTSINAEVVETLSKIKSENPSPEAQEALWKKPRLDLARADRLKFDDERLEDARLMIETRGLLPEKTLSYANAFISKYPSLGRGHYLKAYSEWKRNLKEDAIAEVTKASELDFKNDIYRDCLKALKSGDSKVDPFREIFRFGVTPADFKD